MSYLVPDIEAASIPGGELQSFGLTHSAYPTAPPVDLHVFENLIAADSAVAVSARHIEQVMDAVPQHMFILEPDATLSFVNRAAREYLGRIDAITPTERLGAIIHPEDLEALLGAYRDAIAHGIPVEAEARVRSKNGQYRWFLHQLFPLCDEQGRVVRWCGTRIDIDEHKRSKEEAQRENLALREEIDAMSMFEEIVGSSSRLQAVLARVSKVARTDSTVLITGETGTGKELIARAIHKRSDRADRPFVSVNCAAIPRDLIASELFGHEKGAFTGALQRRIGRFELAEGGLSSSMKSASFRPRHRSPSCAFCRRGNFSALAATRPFAPTSVSSPPRIVTCPLPSKPAPSAATCTTASTCFRWKFLRCERKEDIRLLVKYFIHRYCSKAGKDVKSIDKKSLDRLQSYSWPGNIRELQNVIERSAILCDSENFSVDESWLSTAASPARPLSQEMVLQEKELIEAALAECKGRVSGSSGAAAKLGMPPSTLDSKIRALKIDKRRFYAN